MNAWRKEKVRRFVLFNSNGAGLCNVKPPRFNEIIYSIDEAEVRVGEGLQQAAADE